MTERKIIHIDMDAFYAYVEQRDHPELRGKPIAVGHAEQRGVVSAASYEARHYGVRSAMSSLKAKQLCPQLVFVPGRMSRYKEVSAQIHAIFQDYTDIIEPLSLFSGCYTEQKRHHIGSRYRKGNQATHPRGIKSCGFSRDFVQQIPS